MERQYSASSQETRRQRGRRRLGKSKRTQYPPRMPASRTRIHVVLYLCLRAAPAPSCIQPSAESRAASEQLVHLVAVLCLEVVRKHPLALDHDLVGEREAWDRREGRAGLGGEGVGVLEFVVLRKSEGLERQEGGGGRKRRK